MTTTFRVLSKTENEAAVPVLVPALDSPDPAIQEGALRALLSRRNPAGQREILRRLQDFPPSWKTVIREFPGRLTSTLRDAVLSSDESLCLNACLAAVMFRDYDLIPTLLAAMEDPSPKKSTMAAEVLLELTLLLYDELSRPRDPADRHDPQWIRQHVVASLETAVQRFGRHKRREAIEAFLLLVPRENELLGHILQNPHHVGFLVTVELISRSTQPGILQLLLDYLDDPQAPSAVLSVIANRGDMVFLRRLLAKIGREIAEPVRQNLKKIESLPWLRRAGKILNQFDDDAQQSLLRLVMASGIPRNQALGALTWMLTEGKPGGRREAASALARFPGAEANNLALRALDDPDPQVQANIVRQMRSRGIPGVLPRLLELLDSPHAVVRRIVRQNLSEFSFPRFLAAFEMLEDEARQNLGSLVLKIDPQTVPRLRVELGSVVRSRRLRGLAITRILEVGDRVEDLLLELLRDEDSRVRIEAAAALGGCRSSVSRKALDDALRDRSLAVQDAARKSLEKRGELPP
ncbi:MAG: HEAT repeat domain-containing protein [Pirellulales bacterium]|nr:HEAT repeat domain-containing protein [Pirellulales bacterium]